MTLLAMEIKYGLRLNMSHGTNNKHYDEICTIYGSGTTTIKTVRNWLKKFRAGSFGLKVAAAQQRRIRTSSRVCVTSNPRYSVRGIADATNISRTARSFICSEMSFIVI
uniref:HTH_48 domain-containing protein n=1 Tax=Glossina austeni TaxID=7395 RepID=A0A1A9VB73_GLOAU